MVGEYNYEKHFRPKKIDDKKKRENFFQDEKNRDEKKLSIFFSITKFLAEKIFDEKNCPKNFRPKNILVRKKFRPKIFSMKNIFREKKSEMKKF